MQARGEVYEAGYCLGEFDDLLEVSKGYVLYMCDGESGALLTTVSKVGVPDAQFAEP